MKIPTINAREKRRKLGLNQIEFWGPIGVNQSVASRYERERRIPNSVQALLVLRYGTPTQKKKMLAELERPLPPQKQAPRVAML